MKNERAEELIKNFHQFSSTEKAHLIHSRRTLKCIIKVFASPRENKRKLSRGKCSSRWKTPN